MTRRLYPARLTGTVAAPPSKRSTLSCTAALALTTMTGIPCIFGSTSSPLRPGSIKSSKMRSGRLDLSSRSASVPE